MAVGALRSAGLVGLTLVVSRPTGSARTMTAADTAPPIQLDRYLALLAILLGLVLALLVIG